MPEKPSTAPKKRSAAKSDQVHSAAPSPVKAVQTRMPLPPVDAEAPVRSGSRHSSTGTRSAAQRAAADALESTTRQRQVPVQNGYPASVGPAPMGTLPPQGYHPQQQGTTPSHGYPPIYQGTQPPQGYPQDWSANQPRFYPDPYQTNPPAWPQQTLPPQGYGQPQRRGFATGQQPPVYPVQNRTAGGQQSKQHGASHAKKPPVKPRRQLRIPAPILRRLILVGILAVVVIVGVLVGQSIDQKRKAEAMAAAVAQYDYVFCPGVFVDGIHLGGMTPEEAINAITTQAEQRRDAWRVQLTFQGQLISEISASQLGMDVQLTDAINSAWNQGHAGTVAMRKQAMDELLLNPFNAYSTLPEGDITVIDSILDGIAAQFYVPMKNAEVVTFDASRSTEPFTYAEAETGRYLDVQPVKQRVYQMLSSMTPGVIELEPIYVKPQITISDLAAKIVTLRATATTDISTASTEDRNKNIIEAFRRINGTIINPGETFSFNSIVGERSLKNGFLPAPEYTYGQEVMGVGGGVCQASTTVYQAAVRSGMEILKRDPHSMEVRYAAWGTDATVNSTRGHEIDLKFRNNTAYPIYIKAGVESKEGNRSRLVTRVTIYGQYMGDGVTYNFDTKLETILPPEEAQIEVDKKAQYVTYDDETHIYQEAKSGLKVTSYQVKYVAGFEQDRIFLDTDTYKPKPQIIYIGATQRPVEWPVTE